MTFNDLIDFLSEDGKINDESIRDVQAALYERYLAVKNVAVPTIGSRTKGNVVQYYTTMPARYSKTGKRHQIVGCTEREVVLQFRKEAYEVITHNAEAELKETILVQDVVKKYLKSLEPKKDSDTGKKKKSTISKYWRIYFNYIENTEFGLIRMKSVKRYHCEDYIQYLYGRKIGKGYIVQIKSVIKTAFDYAVDRDIADKNYIAHIFINESLCSVENRREIGIWEDDEVIAICKKSLEYWERQRYRYSAILPCLIFLGCRLGEFLALSYNDVDFVRQTATFSSTLVVYTDYDKHKKCKEIDTPKRPDSRRVINLNDAALFWLKEIKARNEALGIKSNYFATTKKGNIPREEQIAVSCQRFCSAIGIQYKASHTCRRTYTTVMIDGGIPVSQVSYDLGHKKVSTTLNSYYKVKKEGAEMIMKKNKIFENEYGNFRQLANLATLGNTSKQQPANTKTP